MSPTDLPTLLATLVALIVAVLHKFNWLPSTYDALVAAGLGLLAQVVLAVVAQNPTLSSPVFLVVSMLVGALTAVAGTALGKLGTQTKLALTRKK